MRRFSLLVLPVCLLAQTTPPLPPGGNDPLHPKTTIVVTASRGNEELDKSPSSTSVVTRKELEARESQTVDQSLALTPGLYVQRTKGPADTQTRVAARGFNGASRTLVLLDGQPLNDAYAGEVLFTSLPIEELDRVEVVRGPSSTLYGGQALGGVVNILTRPIGQREIQLVGQYGTYDTADYSARYSERFFNRLGISLGYQRLQSGGYASRFVTTGASTAASSLFAAGVVPTLTNTGAPAFIVGRSGNAWYNQHAYRVKGEYAFTGVTLFNFQYIRQDSAYGYDAYQTFLRDASGNPLDRGVFQFNPSPGAVSKVSVTPSAYLQGPGQVYSNFFTGSLQHKFGPRNFVRADAGYYNQPSYAYRTPGTTAASGGGPGTNTDRATRNYHGNLQDNWTLPHRNNLVFGAETRHDMSNSNVFNTDNWTIAGAKTTQNYYAIGRNIDQAFYVQDQFGVTERLSLVAGGRVDYWKTYDGAVNPYSTLQPFTRFPDRTSVAVTGKIAAVYSAPHDWLFRASVGSAFRNPNIYDLYASTVIAGILYEANPFLKPERLKSWEAGFRKQIGTRFNFDGVYYENYIDDLIYRQSITATDRINVNAASGKTRGTELSASSNLLPWLQLRGNYTYTHALITSNPAVPLSVGKHVPYTPAHTTTGELLLLQKRFTGSLNARYVSRLFSSDTNTDIVKGVPGGYDPFFVMGVTLGYQITRRVAAFTSVEDLLDRRYYSFYLNPGRTVNVGVRLKL